MKDTSDRIICVLLGILLVFGVLSFFVAPAYEKGVWLIIGAIVAALSAVLGFKFGVHIPKADGPQPPNQPPREGQNGQTK
ncbi:MAG: hypothetical protein KGL39_16980 [Patescibacteria group bacterium]|nr:hypothetical protein [Patescibacteria group bacterium]